MARIRTIKPEFWTDEDLSEVSEPACLLALGLLNYADDEGYFNANPKLIKASVFPLREPSVPITVQLRELSDCGYISLFSTSDGKNFGVINNFQKHQVINKPKESKIKELDLIPYEYGSGTVSIPPGMDQGKEQGKDQNTLSDFGSNRTDEAKTASPEKPPAPEKPEPEQPANRDAGIEPEPGTDQAAEHAGESDLQGKPDDRDKPGEPDPVDQAFGEIFWKAGLCKVGKLKACSAFRSKYRDWKKSTHGSPPEFASMLADDIRRRLSAGVFGVDKLHPATYLNQERWNDELPAASASVTGGDSPVRDVSHLSEEQRRELAMYELLEGR